MNKIFNWIANTIFPVEKIGLPIISSQWIRSEYSLVMRHWRLQDEAEQEREWGGARNYCRANQAGNPKE